MKILVAEDDRTSRTMLAAVLRKWGFEPVVTENGEAAWKVLQAPNAPKLMIVDWDMPKMDGLEFCRKVRQRASSNPPYIVLLTAREDLRDIVHGLEGGANDYITKPYRSEELLARLRVGRRMLDLQADLNDARDQLEHQAGHDALTGILNRRAITAVLGQEIQRARRSGEELNLALLDIDHFKAVNDTHGHRAGDEVLVGFAARLSQNIRAYDHLGRYGGEEFLIVAPGGCGACEPGWFERLGAAVAKEPIPTSAGPLSITVSIGVACREDHHSVDSLLADADAAMYRAKNAGRNRVVYADLP